MKQLIFYIGLLILFIGLTGYCVLLFWYKTDTSIPVQESPSIALPEEISVQKPISLRSWESLLPNLGQEQSYQYAVQSIADPEIKESFTGHLKEWFNQSKPIPEDPVTQSVTEPVFPYNEQDAHPTRETLPGSLPIPADFPASNRYDTDDANDRKKILNDASNLLQRLQTLRKKSQPIVSTDSNLPISSPIQLPKESQQVANKFVPSPEEINQSIYKPVPGESFTEVSDSSVFPACRFINTPQCIPNFPYYTGASIGVEGGGQTFRCNGPDNAERAEAVVSIENGRIQKGYIVKPGKSYTLAPKVVLFGGGGEGAKIETRINPTTGEVVDLIIRNGGNGYSSTPRIELDAPGLSDQCYLCCSKKT